MTVNGVDIIKTKAMDIFSVSLRSDGIMHIEVEAAKEVDIQHVISIVETVKEVGDEKIYPLLIVAGENTLPTHEARLYIATPESDPYASAEAYVLNSIAQKLVGNFFLNFNKPSRPTKIFTDIPSAIEWLQGFITI